MAVLDVVNRQPGFLSKQNTLTLKTSVPRLMPPSIHTGTLPCTAATMAGSMSRAEGE